MIRLFRYVVCLIWLAGTVQAQNPVWVQIEAQPTLTEAQNRARSYAAELEDVAGFYLRSGWYGIVLGPYTPADAETLMRQLKRERRIPGDSFIALSRSLQQQFWPVGVAAATTARPLPGTSGAAASSDEEAPLVVAEPEPIIIPDETPRQARQSEALLTRAERELLQVALKWAGFYTGAIDGAYGRGTRGAMESWQIANNHEATGVLTTAQRAELITAYNAVLDGMNLQLVRDDAAGIEIKIPSGVVAFADYEPPFARYDAKREIPAQLLLISQEGDQSRLFGLYEILQTLEIMPMDGPRERRNRGFEITGANDKIVTYAFAQERNNRIKGFILVWPANDEERRTRVLDEMRSSFSRIQGVLDPAIAPPDEDQAVDLVSGLAVRKPLLSRSGFFVDSSGTVVTTTEVVNACERITIDADHEAEVAYEDAARGLAVLRPVARLAPVSVAAFQTAVPRLQTEVAVAGYPFGDVLVTPTLTFGRLADLRGLNGEEDVRRLDLLAQSGDAGGPVFDNGGAVLGMLLPRNTAGGRILPQEVSFAIDAQEILAALADAGVTAEATDAVAFMPPETLTRRAADQTVLVSCW